MSDRPSFLIIVTGKSGLKLFSAHHTAEDAGIARDSLEELGIQVHLIEVPQAEGVVKSEKPAMSAKSGIIPLVDAGFEKRRAAEANAKPQEQPQQATRKGGERDGFRDDKYVGAFS